MPDGNEWARAEPAFGHGLLLEVPGSLDEEVDDVAPQACVLGLVHTLKGDNTMDRAAALQNGRGSLTFAARGRIATQRWLHAAQSYFHDVTQAVAHSIPVAWINRKGERVTGAAWPDWEFRTLTELADWLA